MPFLTDLKEFECIPTGKGSYFLLLHLQEKQELSIGRLGQFTFPAGEYAYFGSAFGPGGLRARLRHHLRSDTSPHWHIDWLKIAGKISAVYYEITDVSMECTWAQYACSLPGAQIPAPGFGSSDCTHGCPTHLVYFSEGIRGQNLIDVTD